MNTTPHTFVQRAGGAARVCLYALGAIPAALFLLACIAAEDALRWLKARRAQPLLKLPSDQPSANTPTVPPVKPQPSTFARTRRAA